MRPWDAPADIETLRRLTRRRARIRRVDHPTVVLGSTQREAVLRPAAVTALGAEVVRRRGGGGAVLLLPGDHLWIDAWIPRHDLLWDAEVAAAASWAGAWWRTGLQAAGVAQCEVHRGRAEPGPHDLVCFSGRAPGEVVRRGAKVMGLSQWRSREGALFRACTYTHWDAAPLVGLLDLDDAARARWRGDLAGSAVGLLDLVGPGPALTIMADHLLATFPHFGPEEPPVPV